MGERKKLDAADWGNWIELPLLVCYGIYLMCCGLPKFGRLMQLGGILLLSVIFLTEHRIRGVKTSGEKRQIVVGSLKILMAFYIATLIGTLFLGRVDGSMPLAARRAYYAAHWDTQTNFMPLQTVRRYLGTLFRGVIPKISLMNLLGNVFLMTPMAFLAPCLSKSFRKAWKFILFTTLLLIAIESLQLIFCCGICDVDDVILNLFGALAVYYLIRIPPIARMMRRCYLLPPEDAEPAKSEAV